MTIQTEETKTGTGTSIAFGIEYINEADIKVRVDGGSPLTFTTNSNPSTGQYHIGNNSTTITFGDNQNGKSLHIYRETDTSAAQAVYAAGSSIRSTDLNNNQTQALFAIQETERFNQFSPELRGNLDMNSKKITELGTATADTDATNKTYVDTLVSTTTNTLVSAGTSAPASPDPGDHWFDSEAGRTYVYYTDTSGDSYWVDASPQKDTSAASGALTDGDKGDIIVNNNGANWQIDENTVGPTELIDTAVTAGSYTVANITVDSQGRVTAASSGVTLGDQDYGDITTSNSFQTWTIDEDAVTKSKIADNSIDEPRLDVSNSPSNGQVLGYDSSSSPAVLKWINQPSQGTVTEITAGTGLKVGDTVGGSISSSGTLNIDVGTSANDIVQLDSNGALPAVSGEFLTNLPTATNAVKGGFTLPSNYSNQFLAGDGNWAVPDDTTYQIKITDNSDGTSGTTSAAGENPWIFLDSAGGTDTAVQIIGDNGGEVPTPTGINVDKVSGSTNKLTITHSTSNGFKHIPADGEADNILKYSGTSGEATWAAETDTTYDLTVPAGTTKIRLIDNNSTTDDITITGGTNVTVTRNSGSELTISSTDTTYSNVSTDAAGLVPQALSTHGGKFLRADGSYQVPTDTTYTAGTGLSLSGTEFSLSTGDKGDISISSTGAFNIDNLAVDNDKIANNTIRQDKLAIHDPNNTYGNGNITGITNNKIANVNSNKVFYYGTSSTYQWVYYKLSQECVNVRDFGALGDGTTDDTTAIQNAINFAASWTNYNTVNSSNSTIKGGTVVFPAGKYKITDSLSISDSQHSITLQGTATGCPGGSGDDYGSRIISTMDNEFINIDNSRGIHIKDLTFVGNLTGSENNSSLDGCPTGATGGNGAIHVTSKPGSQNFLFENLVFHRIANCITLKGASRATIRSCVFDKIPNIANTNVIGINQYDYVDDNNNNATERGDQIRIEGCIIDGSPHPGFDGQSTDNSGTEGNGYGGAYYSSGNSANPNTGTNNTECNGLGIYGFVNTVFVNQCSFIRCKNGVNIADSWTGEFLYFGQVEVERANNIGWNLDANNTGTNTAPRRDYITLDNCFASTNYGDAVYVGSGIYGSVTINTLNCRGNRGHGIRLACPVAQNIGIINPIIGGNSSSTTNQKSGISIDNNVHNVYISGGRIGGDGSLGGSATQKYGIEIIGTAHNNMRIIGTNVNTNATSPIYVDPNWGGDWNKIQFNSGTTLTKDTNS